jgi:hypothetical protein
VQLESHALPPQETPQQRYAALHRAIERGLTSDEVWRELAGVALSLGYSDEAVRCARRIENRELRFALEEALARRGCTVGTTPPAAAAPHAGTAAGHRAAPAASDAGRHDDGEAAPTLRDHVADAFQYLFHQHMPWLVLLTTLAFPLVVGLGGLLTAGGSPLLLAAIAALPGLCVVAVTGAMGRQILGASAEGSTDVPGVPAFGELVADARRFFTDAVLVLGSLLGPSLLGLWFGAPLVSVLPGVLVGAFFAPLAWALRHLDHGLGALSPVQLLRGFARTARSYPGVAAFVVAFFVPAAAVAMLAAGRPMWVQIAVVGPLCVLPLFLASRLVGTWIDAHRHRLAGTPRAAAAKPAPRASAQPRPAMPTPSPRELRRPESLEHFRAPALGTAQRSNRPPAPKPRPVHVALKRPPRSIEGRQPAPRPATPAAQAAPAPTPKAAPAQPVVAAKPAGHRPAGARVR